MKCCVCNAEITASWTGRKPKYCSNACMQKAKRLRAKLDAKSKSPCPRKKKVKPDPVPDPHEEVEYTSREIPSNRHWDAVAMERDLDEPIETTLRRSKTKLQHVIDDPNTPAGAISSLTKTLIEVAEKLEAVKQDKPSGLDLLAGVQESEDINEQSGAEII